MKRARRGLLTWISALALLCVGAPGAVLAQTPAPAPLTVFAAASLQNAMKDVGAAYAKAGRTAPVFSFAASSALARQIEQGAPADVFVSADAKWMDYLAGKGLLRTGTRRDLLTNHLALIAPKGSTVALTPAKGFPLLQALGPDGKLAMADPDSVPAGLYGKASLTSLGVWDQVKERVAKGENVRAALTFVARGEAPLGIVYDTDAKVDPSVRIVALLPDAGHPPIVYPSAVVAAAKSGEAQRFLTFLSGPQASAVFERYGFKVLAPVH